MLSTTCGWCGVLAHMEKVTDWTWSLDANADLQCAMAAFTCVNCRRMSIGYSAHHADEDPFRAEQRLPDESDELKWLPPSSHVEDFRHVPQEVAAAAQEAVDCRNVGALRGCVQLVRSVVEAVAKDQGAASGKLHQKIERLHEKGLIRAVIRDAAHEIRYLGNEMAHGDFAQSVVTPEDADLMLVLMRAVLDEVYQLPAKVHQQQEARRKSAARRASSPSNRQRAEAPPATEPQDVPF